MKRSVGVLAVIISLCSTLTWTPAAEASPATRSLGTPSAAPASPRAQYFAIHLAVGTGTRLHMSNIFPHILLTIIVMRTVLSSKELPICTTYGQFLDTALRKPLTCNCPARLPIQNGVANYLTVGTAS